MIPPVDGYARRARLDRIVDGDTIDVDVDLGFGTTLTQRLRLDGVDTPEPLSSDELERRAAHAATAYVVAWLAVAALEADSWPLMIQTTKTGKYGRLITKVWRPDGAELVASILAAGYGRPYTGGRMMPWPTDQLERMTVTPSS